VHVFVRPGRDKVLEDGAALSVVRLKVHDAVRRARVSLWPYVRFESESEAA
jgi:hypothetical protein